MKLLIIIIFTTLSLYYLSCNNINSADDDNRLNNMLFPNPVDKNPGKIILANHSNPDQWKMDRYNVDTIYIIEDSIHIILSYGGGCKTHEFRLIAYNYFMESYPVRAALLLSHNSNDDFCKAFLNEELVIDLSLLKEEYLKGNREDQGTIILRILLNNDKHHRLNYYF